MKHSIFFLCIFLVLGCKNSIRRVEKKSEILFFLNSNDFSFSKSKSIIPKAVKDSLTVIDKEKFKIGDFSDNGKFNFSDVCCSNTEFNKRLNFVLLNDSICLLVYRRGGRGNHNVVDYIRYKGNYVHFRYTTNTELTDLKKLQFYIKHYVIVANRK